MRKMFIASSAIIMAFSLSAAGRFTAGNDGTVTDGDTGLEWQACSSGQKWDGTTCQGQALADTWYHALEYCQDLEFSGHDDWRLPAVDELKTIINYTHGRTTPAAYDVFIAGTAYEADNKDEYSYYWSSTTTVRQPASPWTCSFKSGKTAYPDHVEKDKKAYTRCVRDVSGR